MIGAMMDTIFAVSSGQPPAAIAVLRISGPLAFETVRALAGDVPAPRRAVLRALRDADGELLDRALVLCFPASGSVTGEDLAELHLHGGRAVVRAVEGVLAARTGLRRADPGEFTRRALLHGRIDLSEAEGLGDLLSAETEAQRRTALRSAEGALRREVEGWTTRALGLAAQVEALLDHDDEGDVGSEAELTPAIARDAKALADEIGAMAAQPSVERLRDGLRVVLAGPPNAGKSTLLNALADREVAITSDIAGTTRDRIEAPVVREGIAWLLTDTAGLRSTEDSVEAIGVARAEAAMAEADILLWLGDVPPPSHPHHIWLYPRADQRPSAADGRLPISARTGEGIVELWQLLAERAADLLPPIDGVALNQRQSDLLTATAANLAEAGRASDLLIVAEHLRSALRALDAITGRAGVEAMLDALFSRFCIGK
jgi:tRNA modification GTPase